MKKINITLIVIFLTSFVYAQNDYYWSAGKKHYLKQQTNAFVVKLHKEFDFENSQKIKSERNLKELTRIKSDLGIAIANDTLVNAKKLKEYKEFSNAMPVYQLGDLPIFLTGEILMQPKNNASVEDILKLVDINAPEAWGITTGSCPITVAVIDDGVEDHEDLNGSVLQGYTPQFSQQNPDTQGAPNENDPPVTSFPSDPDNPFGHGQCCSGIIAASHNSLGQVHNCKSYYDIPLIYNQLNYETTS